MCEPVYLTAMTVASGVMDFVGQSQAASAQKKANAASTALILQNQQLQIQSLKNQEEEDRVKTTNDVLDNQRAADAARATAAVAAGEAGVAGLSVDALLGDLVRQETENRNNLLLSQDFRQRQRQLDREGVGITSQSQINQLPTVNKPNILEAGLNTAFQSINTYQTAKARTKK